MQQQILNASPNSLFAGAGWGSENGQSRMTFAPGEYLHDKDDTYDFLDPRDTGDLMEWPDDAAPVLGQQQSPPPTSNLSADLNQYVPPTTLADDRRAWATGVSTGQQAAYTAADDVAMVSASASANDTDFTRKPRSPTTTKARVQKAKGKAAAKQRSRSDAKPKSFSSVSSSSSSSSSASAGASAQFSTTGHGGNHNITLRTASRKPKPAPIKIEEAANAGDRVSGSPPSSPEASTANLTTEERRARQNHNVVEKQYRNRLNAQFERLLAVLPANQSSSPEGGALSSRSGGDFDDRRMSKAEVLELARRRIHTLETERKQLRAERQNLRDSVSLMQRALGEQDAGPAVK